MSSAADPAIRALRDVHDDLVARVARASDTDLVRPSGASQWSVAQVLSHLGSGAEIAGAGLAAALAGSAPPEQASYQAVWDRWNAMTPREQADGCVASDAALVQRYESLDDSSRNSLRIQLPFLPEPVGLDLTCALRLNESTLHGWDVAVADDQAVGLHPTAVPVLLGALSGPLSFLVGFLGKGTGTGAVLAVSAVDPDRLLTLRVGEQVSLQPDPASTSDGTLTLPAEALLRLLTGRLGEEYTPAGVEVTGPLDLAALRATFPGF